MTADMQTSSALRYTEDPVTYGAIVASTADIPRSCICTWHWQRHRWHLDATFLGCPWHGRGIA
jgi:hypothetical protein